MMRLKRRNSRRIRSACAVLETVAQHLFRLPSADDWSLRASDRAPAGGRGSAE